MCRKFIFLILFAFVLCSTAMAADKAFYVGSFNPGWYGPEQTYHVETIIAEAGHLFNDIQQFDDDQLNEFGAWVDENTDDSDLIV